MGTDLFFAAKNKSVPNWVGGCLIEDETRNIDPDGDLPETVSVGSEQQDRIGDYRILRKLGEGGMGVVYEAEQQNPRRSVALKVVRGGQFVTDSVVKMFQREAQALARLKHPLIAGIYESGRTPDGQHYFAMELVRGDTLDDWLDKRCPEGGMGAEELELRLGLFGKICEAVAYAHQRGVIHRDIKPTNVLVLHETAETGTHDPSGVPDIKILDFGLARLTEIDANTSTMTEAGAVRGTLRYMSPEQVRGDNDEIDLRTDVYSLGVLLHVMLTGELPYRMDTTSIVVAAKTICEVQPSTLTTNWSGSRKPDRDIETIAQKALEKQAARRYQSVSALAEDVKRYLANHPILARPPSTMYQLRKMFQRHRLGFAFAASVVLLLVALAVTMTIQAGLIASERDRANLEAETSREVSEFMIHLFEVSDPSEALGNTITAREILDQGAGEIRTGLKDQPHVQGRLMDTMGRVYRSLGLYHESTPLQRDAVELLRESLGGKHPHLADALANLATLHLRTGDYGAARPLYEEALTIREAEHGAEHPEVASILNNLGTLALRAGDPEAARQYYERALAMREATLSSDHPDVAESLNNLAILAKRDGDNAQARDYLERALLILERARGSDHPDVAQGYMNLGNLLRRDDPDRAQRYYERALAVRERVFDEKHPKVAQVLNNLGNLFRSTGDYERAQQTHERALAIRRETLGPRHTDVAKSLVNIGNVRRMRGDLAGARERYEEALTIREATLDPRHPRIVGTYYNLACVTALQGSRDDALAFLQQASERGLALDDVFDDADLVSLRGDPRYERVVAEVRKRLAAEGSEP